jgi:hypothetical protein
MYQLPSLSLFVIIIFLGSEKYSRFEFLITKKPEVLVNLFQKGMLAYGKLRLCLVG